MEAVLGLMRSDFVDPVNIGSEEIPPSFVADEPLAQVTINQLAEMAMSIAGKKLRIKHVQGPTGFAAGTQRTDS